jgi:cell division protein FtsI (penicillin-binding protein 3)
MRRSVPRIKSRLAFAAIFFVLLFLAVAVRAFQLQILQGEKLKRLGERQHLKEWIVLPKRGTILDRAGEPLALSLEVQSVYARPRRVKEPETSARGLAQALNLSPAELQQKLKSEKPFVWLKRQISPKEAEKIRALNIEGIGMSFEPNRYYPQGQLAAQVVGFVGRDSQGLEGVELYYDRFIRGESGSPVIERDALGRRVLAQGLEELQIPPGADIHLTIDTSIQHVAEKQLEATVAKYRAKAGIAVVVEPFTGEILALANYPFFNPNNFTRESSQQWRNRAIADSFEPGSTFKTILAAAALEEGVVGKEDLFYCEYGKYSFAGRTIHDTHEYGWLPFYKIIQYSSNIGVTKVAEKLKKERYFKYIDRFGFGRATGIDMPGEAVGMVRAPESWSPIDLATHAFGQGIAVTPLQLVMAYAAVANGGFLMRPFVVRRVVGPGAEVLVANEPHVVRRVMSEQTAQMLTAILKGVVSDGGTGLMASVEGFAVAAIPPGRESLRL